LQQKYALLILKKHGEKNRKIVVKTSNTSTILGTTFFKEYIQAAMYREQKCAENYNK